MSEFKPGQPNIALTEHPNPEEFMPSTDLDVIDADSALEQCCDWSFVVELLDDVLNDRESIISQLQGALEKNDPTAYHKTAHALKGAALNLHLPALVDASRKAELLGKQLEITPAHPELLKMRQTMIEHLELEYDRLSQYMPEARQHAEDEQNGGGEEVENEEDFYEDEEQQVDHMFHGEDDQIDSQQANSLDSMPQSSEPSMRSSQSNYMDHSAESSQPVSQHSSRLQSSQQPSRNLSSINSNDQSARVSKLNSHPVSQSTSQISSR